MPTTWASILIFVIFAAPGLLYQQLAERRRPAVERSALRELGTVVLGSLAVAPFALLLTWLLAWVVNWLPDPIALLDGGEEHLRTHLREFVVLLAAYTTIAMFLIAALHISLQFKGRRLRSISAWTAAFADECPRDHVPYVRVRSTSGTVWSGRVRYFSADLPLEDRELVLQVPLAVAPQGAPSKPVPDQWERVVLKGADIEWMTVKYGRGDLDPGSRRRRWFSWRRFAATSTPKRSGGEVEATLQSSE